MTDALRVAFCGNDPWSVPSLEALAASGHDVAVVITAAPKPAGRGSELRPTAVAGSARALGLDVAEVTTVREGEGFERLAASRPDVLAVVAYGEILPEAVLDLPRIAPVNLHFSLLPELRGASPVQTALLLGLERTGVTTIVMERGLDTGPILEQREVPIAPEDDAGTLGARLAAIGAGVLVETVDRLARGRISPTPQNHERATLAPKIGPPDRELDWTRPAVEVVNRCRALSPEPGAATSFRGGRLKVFRARATDASGEPGRAAATTREGVVVATGDGGVVLLDLAPAGRRRMSGADFVNGFRPEPGERFA